MTVSKRVAKSGAVTFSQGNTLIEVLKGYLKSLERKEAASDGIVRPCEDRKPG